MCGRRRQDQRHGNDARQRKVPDHATCMLDFIGSGIQETHSTNYKCGGIFQDLHAPRFHLLTDQCLLPSQCVVCDPPQADSGGPIRPGVAFEVVWSFQALWYSLPQEKRNLQEELTCLPGIRSCMKIIIMNYACAIGETKIKFHSVCNSYSMVQRKLCHEQSQE